MSHFMSSMPPAGLIEMPPVSKQTPLPISASGCCASARASASPRAGRCALPWPTASSAFMPSFFSSASPRISTSTPCAELGSVGERLGREDVGGLVTRSRVWATPWTTASAAAQAALAASGSASQKVRPATSPAASSTGSSGCVFSNRQARNRRAAEMDRELARPGRETGHRLDRDARLADPERLQPVDRLPPRASRSNGSASSGLPSARTMRRSRPSPAGYRS